LTRLARVSATIQRYVDDSVIAGAVVLAHRHDEEAYCVALGYRDLERQLPMQRDTIFRIASLTKTVAASALLALIERGVLRLYDPVDRYLPELAAPKVMRNPNGPVDDVYPCPRPITVYDLLSFQMGTGWGPSTLRAQLFGLAAAPISTALRVPNARSLDPDAFMTELGRMPLPYEPGKQWLYHTPADVIGVLISRACGKPLEVALRELLFAPLGMRDTGFSVPKDKRERLATLYAAEPDGSLSIRECAAHSQWADPPLFPSAGGGLVATSDDFQTFACMLLGRGATQGVRVLSRTSVEAMSTDTLTPEQHELPFSNFDRYDLDGSTMWKNRGFGLGVSVRTRRVGFGPNVGALWWPGSFGTSWIVDPKERLAATVFTQLCSSNPFYTMFAEDVFSGLYHAIDD
jgi:CubicO group peptidase (beta-lactamase class C family)